MQHRSIDRSRLNQFINTVISEPIFGSHKKSRSRGNTGSNSIFWGEETKSQINLHPMQVHDDFNLKSRRVPRISSLNSDNGPDLSDEYDCIYEDRDVEEEGKSNFDGIHVS